MIFNKSHITPVRLYYQSPYSNYDSRHIDDWEFSDTILPWIQQVDYKQPYKQNVNIKDQIETDATTVEVSLVDEISGITVATGSYVQGAANVDDPTLYIWELDFDLSSVADGIYRLNVSVNSGELNLVSNKIEVCQNHQHLVHLQYTNSQYHEGLIFDTGFTPELLVEGGIFYKSPASKDFSYEDQSLDQTLLSSFPYDTYELIIGDSFGVPDYVIKMVNRILSCDTVLIDGKAYTKNEGAKWEQNEQDGLPTRGWRIEMRESENRPHVTRAPGAVLREFGDDLLLEDGTQILLEGE